MPRALGDQVVVITGASSGIGRQSALLLAERGARLVLAARNEEALHTLRDEVDRLGGTARVCVTDVAEWDQVRRLAEVAAGHFGRVDTWVNCAAVATYGRVRELTAPELARTIQVTLLGQVYGMRAAVELMRDQGEGGIVNIGSALSLQAVPLQAPYVAAKHGVLGFAEALRMELTDEGSPITVSTLLPSSVNTPLFQHACSRLGVLPRPIPPVYQPRVVAEAVLHAIAYPQPRVVVGAGGKALDLLHRLAPRGAAALLLGPGRVVRKQYSDLPDDRVDNLFAASVGPGAVDGVFGDLARPASGYTTFFEQHPNRVRSVLAGVGLLALAALRRGGGGANGRHPRHRCS